MSGNSNNGGETTCSRFQDTQSCMTFPNWADQCYLMQAMQVKLSAHLELNQLISKQAQIRWLLSWFTSVYLICNSNTGLLRGCSRGFGPPAMPATVALQSTSIPCFLLLYRVQLIDCIQYKGSHLSTWSQARFRDQSWCFFVMFLPIFIAWSNYYCLIMHQAW